MKDITRVEDIQLLVDSFYGKVQEDAIIGPFFSKVVWEAHLPKMYGFWSKMILGEGHYQGNPFGAHVRFELEPPHFGHWVYLFCETVDALFAGVKAEEIKQRANSIAQIFSYKMQALHSESGLRPLV